MAQTDPSLETLLELDGEVFLLDNGYWTKFKVKEVPPTKEIPHGINYSLTLHNKYNKRVLGYDNAHAIKPKRKTFSSKKETWDHKHNKTKIQNYEFESAGQLLEDFWKDVNKIIDEV